jgi:hypothetical protein
MNVGMFFAFDLLVAIVLTFVYFRGRAAAAKTTTDHTDAVVTDVSRVVNGLAAEVTALRRTYAALEPQVKDTRAQLNDLILEKGLGRRSD